MHARRLIFAAVLLLATSVFGQTATSPAPTEGKHVYTPADFAQFAPKTALDLLNRVPGFTIKSEDTSQRGLGTATGNVVINGQRLSGKNNDVVTELSRIPVSNVERIEIVDAASLNIPGLSGQVANVIVRTGGITGQWEYRPEFRAYYTDPLFTRFSVSMSGRSGPVQYTFGADNRGNRSGAGGPTRVFNPDNTLREFRDEQWRGNFDQPRLSSRFVYDGPNAAKGNLNLSYGRRFFDYRETGTRTSGSTTTDRLVTEKQTGHDYEAGGDYEFGLGIGRLKLIGLARGDRYPDVTTVTASLPGAGASDGVRFTQTGDEKEQIARGEYRWKSHGSDLQVSVEGAFNSLDNVSRLFALNSVGDFTEEPLPGGIAKVTEDRYEMIGSWGRALSSALTVKAAAGGEYSKLQQVGAGGKTRSFRRPKGELSAAWKASPSTDVNFKFARRVGQLNFFDFLASVDVTNVITNAANPDLVPEQSWDSEIEAVRNLGKLGSTTLRVYHRLIDDIVDIVPIGVDGEAPGNLDRATIYGLTTTSTLNLDRFGWRGVRVDLSGDLARSSVKDPLTFETRPISNALQEAAALSVRYDIPSTFWATGTDWSYQRNALNYRLTEVGRQYEGPVWGDIYVENKNVHGMTVRASVNNLIAADSNWDRTVYAGRRNVAPVASIEHRHRNIGPIFSFQVRGKF